MAETAAYPQEEQDSLEKVMTTAEIEKEKNKLPL